MRTVYEWDVEDWDANGNIQGHNVVHNYREALAAAALSGDSLTPHIVLVCDDGHGRSRAYVVNGVLPVFFCRLGRTKDHQSPRALPQTSIPERVNRHDGKVRDSSCSAVIADRRPRSGSAE